MTNSQHHLPEPQEDDERYFVPTWLEKVREEDSEAIADMTPEETTAYYWLTAAQLQTGEPQESAHEYLGYSNADPYAERVGSGETIARRKQRFLVGYADIDLEYYHQHS